MPATFAVTMPSSMRNWTLVSVFAFEHQDKPMIVAQREAMEDAEFWSMNPIVLEGDGRARCGRGASCAD